MTVPNDEKNNDHIRGDPTAFRHAYLRARAALGRLDGVAGVGFGRKETAGKFTDDISIEVFVREKKAAAQLSDDQRVPDRFEGYRTDVRVVPRVVESADTGSADFSQYPTISGGMQIEAFPRLEEHEVPLGLREQGTLGCIVKLRGDTSTDNVYLLSCAHVLQTFDPNTQKGTDAGDYVYQPFAPVPNVPVIPSQLIGIVVGPGEKRHVAETAMVPTSTTDPTPVQQTLQCYVDAGIAKINVQRKCCDTPCGTRGVAVDTTILHLTDLGLASNSIADVRDLLVDTTFVASSEKVYKRGVRTRGTVGVVTTVNAHATVTMDNGSVIEADNVLEIAFAPTATQQLNNQGDLAFSAKGDSGSIVVDGQGRAVGMIFAEQPHAEKVNPTDVLTYNVYACHIRPVLDATLVCVATAGGTHYGADGATDGSGLVGAADATTDSGGERKFVSAKRVFRVEQRPNFDPLTGDQRDRFIDLRRALRETDRGRRLDDTFLELRQEIGVLVRSDRPVTVVWHRNRGPAFLAHVINHLRGNAPSVPREIDGITRAMLFDRMRRVLMAHGSTALRRALDRHADDVALLGDVASVEECIALLRRSHAEDLAGVEP